MSTNFYARLAEPDSEQPAENLHIGKSSAGWCFALHVGIDHPVIPADLDGWIALLSTGEYVIRSEYEEPITLAELLETITMRTNPLGLERSPIDGYHCIGHGNGTWDLVVGEFC